MVFVISNKQAGMTDGASRQIKRLLYFSMSRFSEFISRVKVNCYDVNGPKGGMDKRCSISAKLKATGQVIAQGSGADYIEAMNNSLEKLVRATRRTIDKRQKNPIRIKRREKQLLLSQIEESSDES